MLKGSNVITAPQALLIHPKGEGVFRGVLGVLRCSDPNMGVVEVKSMIFDGV
jgi:hypothetical protein